VTVSQKMLFWFLLSALLFTGIAAFAVTGLFPYYWGVVSISAQIVMFAAFFLTLFLIIFFCINLRRRHKHEKPEEPETVEETPADFISAEAVQVESLTGSGGNFFMFSQPFSFTPYNPELLQRAEEEVVYEQNGIHYINSNVFADEQNEDELDRNFAKLIESVVNHKEFELT